MFTRRKRATLPFKMERVRQRFEHWRRSRPHFSPIPEALWALAVEVAGEQGVNATAQLLHLNHTALQKRVQARKESPHGRAPAAFVELVPPGLSPCTIELEKYAGGQDEDPSSEPSGVGLGGAGPPLLGHRIMIQLAIQTRILVAVEAVDFRKGIDGLARVCQERLQADPFSGGLFVFRNRRRTALKILAYD